MSSLRNKTISGVLWSFLQKVGEKGLSFLIMLLLARLMTPNDFGLIGMIMIFIEISNVLVIGGFKVALIQKKDTDSLDYSSIFYINLVVSIVLYIITFLGAPYIAKFYDQEILTGLVRVLSLVLIFNAFSLIQETKLTKELRFKTLTIVQIPSNIIGGLIGVGMAYFNFGVWSLLAYYLSQRISYALQIWIYSKWKPLLKFDWKRVKVLFSFGGNLLIANIIRVLYDNLYLILIGKFYPLSYVGYYQHSYNFIRVPSETLTRVINNVTFPVFSSIQDKNNRLKENYKKVIQQTFFWICPVFIFSGVMAYPLFKVIFGEKWLPAVPFYQWLCVLAVFLPLNIYNLDILNVKGRSDLFLRLQILRRVATSVIIIAVFPLGIYALLITQAVTEILTFLLFSHFSGKLIKYSTLEQIKDILPTLMSSLIIGALIYTIIHFFEPDNNFLVLITGILIGGGTYISLAYFSRIQPFVELTYLIKENFFK